MKAVKVMNVQAKEESMMLMIFKEKVSKMIPPMILQEKVLARRLSFLEMVLQ